MEKLANLLRTLADLLSPAPPKALDVDEDDVADDADCGAKRALPANKCVQCCQSAYLRAVQIMEPLEAVMGIIGYTGWEELANDVGRLIGGAGHFESIKEREAERVLEDAGYDVTPTKPISEAGTITIIRRVRPLVRREPRPPGTMPRTPVLLQEGTAQILLDPGWSANPVPVLQQLVVAAKAKIASRTKTKDCCDCVAKRVWPQSTPRKKVKTLTGETIRRRAPGGSPP